MLFNITTDTGGKDQHHDNRDHDGSNHHRNMLHQTYGGNHRIERENYIDYGNLGQNQRKTGCSLEARLIVFTAFDAVPDFQRAFQQQEQAAANQDDVTTGNTDAKDTEQVMGQAHHPGQGQQEQDAGYHRQHDAEKASFGL